MAQQSNFQTGLEGKPWYISAAVAAVLGIAVVAGLHFTKFNTMRGKIAQQDKSLEKLNQQISEGRSAQKSLPQFREEVGRLELELDKLLKILPSQRNTEDLLRRVRQLTEQGDFALLSLTPRGRSERDFYYDWPIQVRLRGSYHNLALFFDRLSRLSRIFTVDNLRITTAKRSRHTIAANFTMKTYLYIDRSDEEEEQRGRGRNRNRRNRR
ncbi:MAG: type 4a pilus biogenesis protein PilO [Acidobacteriota bacterium]